MVGCAGGAPARTLPFHYGGAAWNDRAPRRLHHHDRVSEGENGVAQFVFLLLRQIVAGEAYGIARRRGEAAWNRNVRSRSRQCEDAIGGPDHGFARSAALGSGNGRSAALDAK